MRLPASSAVLLLSLMALLTPVPALAQATGTITGAVTDKSQASLPGAKIVVEPTNVVIVSDSQGRFTLSGVVEGTYRLTVSYIGFSPFTTDVTVAAGQPANVSAVLEVASQSEEVIVTTPRAHGEAEAINEERTTSNILDVLPANVITSLPNANIADAVGRLPSVTLERDEGEGKYVQIRGTEPRLSNLTIDGIEVPSPEGGVRQVKLDTIPADLVQSVQIYKTLEADQPGDAIGGSVNIETKMASDQPTLSVYGLGGLTPIDNTRHVDEFGFNAGRRFGAEKKLGVMVGGSYDYNARGIDDIEVNSYTPAVPFYQNSFVLRQYLYDRNRIGFGADVDYKLGPSSTLWARSLFSNFKDFGHRYEYTINDNPVLDGTSNTNVPSFTTERRIGDFQVADLIVGGDHASGKWFFHWEASAAQARMRSPINGGESITTFSYLPPGTDPINNLPTSNCQYDAAATKNPYKPQFTPACFTEAYNPANFQLALTIDPSGTIAISQTNHGRAEQLNLQGSASAGRSYFLGSHSGLFQFGAWFSNAHKFDDSFENDFTANTGISMTQFVNGFKNPNYYGGSYQFGPGVSWEAVNAYLAANPSAFTFSSTAGGNSNNFDLIERIAAGYLMNTLDFGRFTLIAGVRFEGTQDHTLSYDGVNLCLCVKGNNSYVDVLPSASLQIRLDNDSDIRLAYGRGISRPDPQFLTAATSVDSSYSPPQITIGNPALRPEHANDYDVLYERYLHPVGIVRGGFFYKALTDPIVNVLSAPQPNSLYPVCPAPTCQISQAVNAGSAYITGVEVSFEQHFSYFPGPFRGLGLLANYSYATSQATRVNPQNRLDSPALLRQAPHTWNVSPTFDRGRLSLRAGLAYNGANIYQYLFTDCVGQQVDSSGNCIPNSKFSTPTQTPGGISGPFGDLYLFPHFQVDAQGSYYLGKGWTAIFSGLNLNNGVFGFYVGSQRYFTQREYYKPTYSFGFRWDLHHE